MMKVYRLFIMLVVFALLILCNNPPTASNGKVLDCSKPTPYEGTGAGIFEVFDSHGRFICDGDLYTAYYTNETYVPWNGKDSNGKDVTTGEYTVKISYFGYSSTGKAYCQSIYIDNETVAPAIPTGLIIKTDSSRVSLTWNAVSKATSYICYFSKGDTIGSVRDSITCKTPGCIIEGLENGYKYKIAVAALNDGGISGMCSPITIVIPLNLKSVSVKGQYRCVQLNWESSKNNQVTYSIRYSDQSSLKDAKVMSTANNNVVITGLTNRKLYYFAISVISGNDSSTEVIIKGMPTLSQPDLKIQYGNNNFTLYWDDIPQASSFNLYVRSSTLANSNTLPYKTNVTSPYVLNGLTPGTCYGLAVSALDSSTESIVDSFQWCYVLPVPTGFAVKDTGTLPVVVWDAVDVTNKYILNIWKNSDTGTAWKRILLDSTRYAIGDLLYKDTAAGPGKMYSAAIAYEKYGSQSALSDTVKFLLRPLPPKIISLSYHYDELYFVMDSTKPYIDSALSYLEVNANSDSSVIKKLSVKSARNRLLILEKDKQYSFRMTSMYKGIESKPCSTYNFNTNTPKNLRIVDDTSGLSVVAMAWDPVPNVQNYIFEYFQPDSLPQSMVGHTQYLPISPMCPIKVDTIWNVEKVRCGWPFKYIVRAQFKNPSGISFPSDTLETTISCEVLKKN
jgi:hypothetical protein